MAIPFECLRGYSGPKRFRRLLFVAALARCALPGDDGAAEFRAAAAAGFEPPLVVGAAVPFVEMARWGGAAGVLTVYVEGDGAAWRMGMPPDNPTPRVPVALDLAISDGGTPVVYLGRPCQFMAWRAAACPTRLWAEARFGAEVIDTMDAAVVEALRRTGARRLVLVGFSGGAAVAALLALRHPETVLLVTVAGVVDHAAWTRLQGVAPLTGSLNPADRVDELARLPQVHLVGTADRVVPAGLIEALVAQYGAGSERVRVVVTGNGHDCCWADGWGERIRGLRLDVPGH